MAPAPIVDQLPRIPDPSDAGDVLREQLDCLLEERELSSAEEDRLSRVSAILLEPFEQPKRA
jgi:hypothetical protein